MSHRNPLKATAWPQREEFRKALQDYMASSGTPFEALAAIIGMKPGSLRDLFYNSRRKPPRLPSLQKAAELTRRPLSDFVDDAGAAALPGVPAQVMSLLSPAKRNAAQRIITSLGSEALTDAQALHLADMVRSMLRATTPIPAKKAADAKGAAAPKPKPKPKPKKG